MSLVKSLLMKKGECLKEKRMGGALFQNVFKTQELGVNVTHLLPGTSTEKFSHQGQEVHLIIKGELDYHVGREKFKLTEGDMLMHSSESQHWSVNTGAFECVYATVSTSYTFIL
jgi:quercetin dioxygenase-like cupin family protein